LPPPVKRAILRPHHQFDRGLGLALAAPDRGVPVTLDQVEQRLAALVLQDLSHEFTERMHVVAQRRVLEWEENAFAGHGRGSRAVWFGWSGPHGAA